MIDLLNLNDAVSMRPIDPITEGTREAIARCMADDGHNWREPAFLIGEEDE